MMCGLMHQPPFPLQQRQPSKQNSRVYRFVWVKYRESLPNLKTIVIILSNHILFYIVSLSMYVQDFQLLLLRTVEALSLMILLARQASVTTPAPAPLMTTLFAKYVLQFNIFIFALVMHISPTVSIYISRMTSPCQNRLRTLEFHQLVEASDNYDLVLEVCREMIEAIINDETISQDFVCYYITLIVWIIS